MYEGYDQDLRVIARARRFRAAVVLACLLGAGALVAVALAVRP